MPKDKSPADSIAFLFKDQTTFPLLSGTKESLEEAGSKSTLKAYGLRFLLHELSHQSIPLMMPGMPSLGPSGTGLRSGAARRSAALM